MMRRLVILAAAFVAMVAMVTSSAGAFKVLKEGSSGPSFSLAAADGGRYDLEWVKGNKASLLVFWATWSPRSKTALEAFADLYNRYHPEGLNVLAVNVEGQNNDSEKRAAVDKFMAETPLPFPVVIDDGLITFNDFGVITVPSTALLDSQGTIVYEFSSFLRGSKEDTEEAVKKTLGIATPTPTPLVQWSGGYQPDHQALLKNNMAIRVIEMGMIDQGVEYLNQAIEIDPKYPEPYFSIGEILLQKGEFDQAVNSLKQGLDLAPSSVKGLVSLAKALVAKNDFDGALTEIEKLSPEARSGPAALALEGDIYNHRGDLEKAAHAYRQAIEILLEINR